jgi:hypothetical protein
MDDVIIPNSQRFFFSSKINKIVHILVASPHVYYKCHIYLTIDVLTNEMNSLIDRYERKNENKGAKHKSYIKM